MRSLVLLAVLFAAEALVFYSQLADQIVAYYPMNFDQTGYMNFSFRLLDAIHSRGWSALVGTFLHPPTGSGVGMILQGALFAMLGGPNRTALLTLNLAYFFALQLVLFHTVQTRTRNDDFAWFAVALLLSFTTIFSVAGGIYDYRIDFCALCLYAIWTCLIVWSRGFRDPKPSLVSAAVAAVLVATRYFTILYLGGVLLGLLIAASFATRSANPTVRAVARKRARHILDSGLLIVLFTTPVLLPAIGPIYDKYVVAHILTDEKYIRAQEVGVHNAIEHILFYPRSILFQHIGSLGLRLMALSAVLAVLTAVWYAHISPRRLIRRLSCFGFEFLALGLAVILPVTMLTVDIAKSTVVGGIACGPILLIAILFLRATLPFRWTSWRGRSADDKPSAAILRILRCLPLAIRIAVSTVVLAAFLRAGTANQRSLTRIDLAQVDAINRTIARFLVENQILDPKMYVDRTVDYLYSGTVELYAFEHFRTRLKFDLTLDADIFAESRDTVLDAVRASDVVVVTDPVRERSPAYPATAAIRGYWDDIRATAMQDGVLLKSVDILGIPHEAYVRPPIKIGGNSGGWITSAGATIQVDGAQFVRWPVITLEGTTNFNVLQGEPRPTAVIIEPADNAGKVLPSEIKRTGDRYEINVDASSIAGLSGGLTKIQLTFDRFFVPSKLGINADTRELVIRMPERRELREQR